MTPSNANPDSFTTGIHTAPPTDSMAYRTGDLILHSQGNWPRELFTLPT